MSHSLEIFTQMIQLKHGLIQDWNKFTDFTESVIQIIQKKELKNHQFIQNYEFIQDWNKWLAS